MKEKKLEIKGYFVYIDGKLIKPNIVKLRDIKESFPFEINSSEIAYVDNLIFQDEEYIYRIIVIPAKYVGKYYNKFPSHKFEKTSFFQILRGKAKITSHYEEGNGRYFYKGEDMINEYTYVIEKGSCVGFVNVSYEKAVILCKTPLNGKRCEEVFFIGENGYEQNPSTPVFGEKKIEKKEYSLIKELLAKLKS